MTRYRPPSSRVNADRWDVERADAYECCAEANDEMRLNELIKWAAVAVLSMGAAAPSLGGSVTRPGDTIGLTVEVPLPEGLHLGNTTTEQCADESNRKLGVCGAQV